MVEMTLGPSSAACLTAADAERQAGGTQLSSAGESDRLWLVSE